MKFNKKGIMMLPLAALLFTSCSPWKGVDYKGAVDFINQNYKIDGAKPKLPTIVREKLHATAANEYSMVIVAFMPTMSEVFYNYMKLIAEGKLQWTDKAPYKCDYEEDYIPKDDMSDYLITPLVTEYAEGASDILAQSFEEGGMSQTVTYEVNGKKFKQNKVEKMDIVEHKASWTYNDEGYRLEVTSNARVKGKIKYQEQEVNLDYSYEFSATYTYAE